MSRIGPLRTLSDGLWDQRPCVFPEAFSSCEVSAKVRWAGSFATANRSPSSPTLGVRARNTGTPMSPRYGWPLHEAHFPPQVRRDTTTDRDPLHSELQRVAVGVLLRCSTATRNVVSIIFCIGIATRWFGYEWRRQMTLVLRYPLNATRSLSDAQLVVRHDDYLARTAAISRSGRANAWPEGSLLGGSTDDSSTYRPRHRGRARYRSGHR